MVSLNVREDTNDGALAIAILTQDEYDLRGAGPLEGWALDIGSHIGTVALALAHENPSLQVIAVEPVPDNAALIRANVLLNGLQNRVHVEEAGAAGIGMSTVACMYGYTDMSIPDKGYIEQNRFIGNIWRMSEAAKGQRIEAPALTIRDLADKYGAPEFRFTKIDCEGCEWDFLAKDAKLLVEIVGEWHDAGPDRIAKVLRRTHDVTILHDYGGSGIFRAVRR